MSMSVKLYVLDSALQRDLPEEKRDETVALKLGAQWTAERDHMIAPDGIDPFNRAQLLARFATPEAERRYDQAMEAWLAGDVPPVRVSNVAVARAARAEFAGTSPEGRTDTLTTAPGRVVGDYLYSVHDRDSLYSHFNLEQLARAHAVTLSVDSTRTEDGQRGPYFGLRYVEGGAPEALKRVFSTPAARAAWLTERRREAEVQQMVRQTAAAVAGDEAKGLVPLTLPRPPQEGQPRFAERAASFEKAARGIRSIRTEKLERLVDLTRAVVERLTREANLKRAEGQPVPDEERREFGRLSRGLMFGEAILRERQQSRDRPAQKDPTLQPERRNVHKEEER